MSSKELELPASLQRLFDTVKGGEPATILSMYDAVFGDSDTTDRRYMQQRLGAYVTKLNRRLKGVGQAVKPGDLKGTYVLTSV